MRLLFYSASSACLAVSILFLALICTTVPSAQAALPFSSSSDVSSSIYFCKCICFSNYTILPLYRPADPAKPCLSCTKQFCLDQKLAICKDASKGEADYDTATGDEGDVQTKCFQRDSSLSYSVVTIFIILTVGLLIGALMKDKLQAHMSTSPLLTRWTQIGKRGSFNRSYVGVGR